MSLLKITPFKYSLCGVKGSNAGAIAGAVIGVILGLLLIAGIVVGVVFLVLKMRNKSSYPPPRYKTYCLLGIRMRIFASC